jgi:ribonuclease PH
MSDATTRAADAQRTEMVADLQRLVEALDRRVPRLERLGETAISEDAAELREKATTLIAKLTGAASNLE